MFCLTHLTPHLAQCSRAQQVPTAAAESTHEGAGSEAPSREPRQGVGAGRRVTWACGGAARPVGTILFKVSKGATFVRIHTLR